MTTLTKTARRSEIVRTLREIIYYVDLSGDYRDAIEEAALIIEHRGIPFDEIADIPNSHRGDPDTSHGFRVPDSETHLALLSAFRWAKEGVAFPQNLPRGGLTPDEAAERAGLTPGPGPRKRVSELKNAGMIDGTPHRRATVHGRPAQVLAITEFGLAELRRLGR